MKDRKKINGIITVILALVLILVLLGVFVIAMQGNKKEGNDKKTNVGQSETESGRAEKWKEGTIEYNGKNYKYNQDLNVYLLMGIDTDYTVEDAKIYDEGGGQSDAMFLLVTDPDTMEMSVISINRNSMTRVEVFSENGSSGGYYDLQICLQHAYGDGAKLSCTRTVDAVSYLFYNLPIEGYLSINMGAVPIMNDSVGGVEVEVLEDLESGDIHLTKGETVTLDGEQAYLYLRGRDTDVFDSSTGRLRRQEQYISNYLAKLKDTTSGNSSSVVSIYNSISDYIVTDMSAVDIITELMGYTYDPSSMYTVPGETVMGDTYEEYHVDASALYDLIIQIFYQEVTE